MIEHQLIEPSPLTQLQMSRSSSIYDLYLHNLKKYPREDAVLRTRDFILSRFPMDIDEQIVCLEFFYMNDFFEDLAVILHSPYIKNEVKYLYELMHQRVKTPVTKEQLYELSRVQFSHPSLHCLQLFLLVYSYYDLKIYTALDKYLEDCDQALRAVNEPLMYYYLNQRYQELLFHHYWKTDNSILASRYAYKMINAELSPRRKSRMYHILSLCQLFNGYESAMDPLNKALEIAEAQQLQSFVTSINHHTLPFIAAFHQRTEDVFTPDPIENAHLALANGDYKTTRKTLQSLTTLTPFQESYLGLATYDSRMLENSYKRFIHERGDHFFARIPLEYMKRMKTN
ncbi:AimR family lysis-lysogeny pheromone receptor [Halobacillus litoralis]|uniref:AimR family lysis-lysogeny pheromone receptor n=1 Tax=Halobacillus litoralis TaxID=45668 RepID=UPI001CFE5E5D|nr:AimR family lysis-lysogeny pheromone receptor [Halobacillus litoralis]